MIGPTKRPHDFGFKADGKTLPGLVRRRAAEVKLFLGEQ